MLKPDADRHYFVAEGKERVTNINVILSALTLAFIRMPFHLCHTLQINCCVSRLN